MLQVRWPICFALWLFSTNKNEFHLLRGKSVVPTGRDAVVEFSFFCLSGVGMLGSLHFMSAVCGKVTAFPYLNGSLGSQTG